jgi:endoglucanase
MMRGWRLALTAWLVVFAASCGTAAPPPTLSDPKNATARPPTAAFDQNKRLGRGMNILGYDPIWRSPSEARFKAEYFHRIREAGFHHVRINLHPFRDAASDGRLSDYYWKTLDWAIQQSLDNQLAVILDFHEFLEMAKEPKARKARFLDIWQQMAERYRNAPNEVFFEILNEPNGKLTPALWNRLLGEALAIIRRTNPNRTVVIGPGRWNGIDSLEDLRLPENDRNVIVTIHYYSPFEFTHQGASWTEHKDKRDVKWNGTDEERQAVMRDFAKAQAWATKHGRPLYLGEFGAYDKADTSSRGRYLAFIARYAEEQGWSWAYWQFESDFVAFDVGKDCWVRPILDALIPPGQNFQANPP